MIANVFRRAISRWSVGSDTGAARYSTALPARELRRSLLPGALLEHLGEPRPLGGRQHLAEPREELLRIAERLAIGVVRLPDHPLDLHAERGALVEQRPRADEARL